MKKPDEKTKRFAKKALIFETALTDCYREEGERELEAFPRMHLTEEELTEDFQAMIYALYDLHQRITEDPMDVLEFTYLMNRLVFQHLLEKRDSNGTDEAEKDDCP